MAQEELVAVIRAELGQFKQTFDQAAKIVQQTQTAATAALKQAQAAELAATRAHHQAVLETFRQVGREEVAAVQAAQQQIAQATRQGRDAEVAVHRQAVAEIRAAAQQQRQVLLETARAIATAEQGSAQQRLAAQQQVARLELEAQRQANRQRVQEVRAANAAVQQETSGFQRVLAGALSVAGGLGIVTSLAAVVTSLKNVATESVAAATRMQSLTAAFTLISGGAGKAQATLAFLRSEATRLGIDFVTSAESFKRFDAAARGTALEGEKARTIFTAVSEAMRVVGGTSDQTKGALIALEQIISKGKVSSEELRGQLGEHLPGAFQIAARAMGVTTAELGKMLEAGDLLSTDFLPRFAAQLRKEFGPGVEAAAQTAAATFAKLGNEVQALGEKFGRSLLSVLKPGADLLEQLLRQTREATTAQEALAARTLESARAGKPVIGGAQSFAAAAPTGATEAEIERLRVATDRLTVAQENLHTAQARAASGFLGSLVADLPFYEKRVALTEKQLKVEEDRIKTRLNESALNEAESASFGEHAVRQERQAAANTTHKKQLEEILTLHKQLPGELDKAAVKADLLASSFTTAEVRLAELRKHAGEVQKLLDKKPTLLLDPQIKAVVEDYRAREAVLVKTVALEKEQEAAVKRTSAEATQAAKQRVETEKGLQAELITLREDEFEADRQLLARDLAELRKNKVDATLITAIEAEKRQDILRREVEAALETLGKEQVARETLTSQEAAHRQEITQTITGLEARESRSQVDDFRASLAAKREGLVAHYATTDELRQFDLAAERAVQRLITDEAAKALKDQQRETERALKEQERAYEQTYGRIRDKVSEIFQGLLNRTIRSTRDLLDVFKDLFFKTLSDIAARALTQAIIVPVVAQGAAAFGGLFGGAADALGGAGAGVGGGGTAGALLGLGGTAQQVSGAFGGPTLASLGSRLGATVLIPAAGAATGIAGTAALTAFPSGGFAAGGSLGPGLFATQQGAIGAPIAAAGGAGLTLGGAIAGVGAGVGAGFGLRQLNDVAGLTNLLGKRGSSALAGAGGGALGGALIGSALFPGIGTAAGAIVGTLVGALGGGLLGGGKKERIPELTLTGANAPRIGFDALTGLSLDAGQFGVSSRSRNFGQAQIPVHDAIQRSTTQLLEGLASSIGQFPKELQERAVPELQRLADEFGATFQGVRFKGKDVQKQVETFVNETIPETFNDLFSPFVERLERVAPVLAEFDRVIAALEAQQTDLLHTLDTARAAILAGPQTTAGLFQERRALLDTLVAESAAGTPAEQAALVPQIAGLAQEVAQLSRQEGALVTFNAELQALHAAVELSTSVLQAEEVALQASEAALEAQSSASATALRGVADALEAEKAASTATLRSMADAFEAEKDASTATLRGVADALKSEQAASDVALRGLADALETEQRASEVALRGLADALDAQRAASARALQAEEAALDAAAATLRTLTATLQETSQILQTMAASLASSQEAFASARATIIEGTQGPAQLFEARQATLQALVGALPGASLEGRVAAFPEIAALTEEVFLLAKQGELFGDDVLAMRQLQQRLLAQLDQAAALAREAQAVVAAQQADVTRQAAEAQAAFAAQQAAFLQHQQETQAALANQQAQLLQAQQQAEGHFAAREAQLLQAQQHAQAHFAAQEAQLLQAQQHAQAVLAQQEAVLVHAQQHAQAHFAAQEAQLLQAQQHAQAVLANQQAVLVQAQVAHQTALAAHDNLLAHEAARTQAAQAAVQQDLVRIIESQRATTEANFTQAINETRAQRETLLTTLQVTQTQEYHLANAVAYLASINSLTAIQTRRLEVIGSFQTAPGDVRQIPRTGLALVHQGELIGRPGRQGQGDVFAPTIHLTINAPGAEPQAVAAVTTGALEQTLRELDRRKRYRQTRVF